MHPQTENAKKSRAHKSRDLRDLDRGHKDTPGDTFWMTWIYFLGDIDPFRVTFKFLLGLESKYLYNKVCGAQNWTLFKFLTLLCMFLGFLEKFCRKSRSFRVQFFVANHAILGDTF